MHATHADTLNGLLQGEIAATETYQQAMDKLDGAPGTAELDRIHAEHRESANTLRLHVRDQGGEPEQDSGAWGAFAKAVEGGAKLFGTAVAIKALKEGEESGIRSYQAALDDGDLPNECRQLIQSRLLPQTREHVATLDRILAGA